MLFLSLAAVLAAPAMAEESEFAGAEAPVEEVKEPEGNLSAELGGAYADGNSWYYTLNTAVNGGYRWQANKLSLAAGANLGRAASDADGDGRISDAERPATVGNLPESARRIEGELRYDRFVSERGSVYALAGAFTDVFSGYDLRAHEQVGYSHMLLSNDTTTLKAELGADYAQEYFVEGTDPAQANVLAARVLVGVTHEFNESVSFSDTVEVYENVLDTSDLRVLNKAVVSSKLNDTFSLKLSHSLNFDNQPVEGFKPLDHITMVTLVATLL